MVYALAVKSVGVPIAMLVIKFQKCVIVCLLMIRYGIEAQKDRPKGKPIEDGLKQCYCVVFVSIIAMLARSLSQVNIPLRISNSNIRGKRASAIIVGRH